MSAQRSAAGARHGWALAALGCIAVAYAAAGPARAEEMALQYPETKTVEHTDDYHGVTVADPYRWLEADVRESEAVAEWVAAQSAFTADYLAKLPERAGLEERLRDLWNYPKYSSPWKAGGRYYHFKNDGLQNQAVLHVRETLDAEPRVLIDPNAWTDDGTQALSGVYPSDDGRYLAYGVADAGSDWKHIRVMEVESGKLLEDRIDWVKFSGARWTRDSKGFFYGRFDEPEPGAAFQSSNLNQKLYYHRIGAAQGDDVLAYARPDQPDWTFGAQVTEDGRYLVISYSNAAAWRNGILYKDLHEPYGMPLPLIDRMDQGFSFVGNDGPLFYFHTDDGAPMARLIAIDIRRPEPEHWRDIIPESDAVLEGVSYVGNLFVAAYLDDVKSRIRIYDVRGAHVRDVALPGIGSAGGFGGKQSHTETFYSFTSFVTPTSIYRYDLITGDSTLLHRSEIAMDPEVYTVEQRFFASKDGTQVPMFIVHRKDLKLEGSAPTILYGYGGFNIALAPSFIGPTGITWLDQGGVYAVANLRGGGEYGEAWHEAGMGAAKQNVFDDFIAAAECLIADGYCSPETLAIRGGSNGGLLVGAVVNQRPELFAAALPAVGVMDMLRFHEFTAGRFWTHEYGSSDDEADFQNLYGYSPYHNIAEGADYPAILVMTADTDDRVVPGHSFKYAARLQAAQRKDGGRAIGPPRLIRIETKAGHGAGKPTDKAIQEAADALAFALHHTRAAAPAP